jgi:LPS O-antigen subunit length determinant protein (WzzB/FepE family)
MQVRGHGINQAIATNEKEMGILARQSTGANTVTTMGAYLITSERSKLLEQRLLVEQKQTELRMAMSELQSSPTTLLKTPTLPADPVKPRPLLYFLLASGIGLAMGIFIAYVMEFARRAVRPPE